MSSRLGILVGGGPAPGINSVIGAATIRACTTGHSVVGILDGYQWLMEGDTAHVTPLSVADATQIHFTGGSILGTSRANPMKSPEAMARTLDSLKRLGVQKLICIGGDGTSLSARRLIEASHGTLDVVHVPKTIDNDIDLPQDVFTFGYQTARHIGAQLLHNLMVDAQTTSRWYLVVTMGRKAGHLALGIGKAAGATLTLIPEEFGKVVRLRTIVDTLVGAMIKRMAHGRSDGVAVLAEGLADIMPEEDLAQLGVKRDELGRLKLTRINLGDVLMEAVERRLLELGIEATVVSKNIGYEMRSADPIPMDMEYTRDLGYCAARHVIEGGTNTVICLQQGHFRPVPLESLLDPKTGHMRVRLVDIHSTRYRIARNYMLRLRGSDFDNELELTKLALASKMTPTQFVHEFEYLRHLEPMSPARTDPPPDSSPWTIPPPPAVTRR